MHRQTSHQARYKKIFNNRFLWAYILLLVIPTLILNFFMVSGAKAQKEAEWENTIQYESNKIYDRYFYYIQDFNRLELYIEDNIEPAPDLGTNPISQVDLILELKEMQKLIHHDADLQIYNSSAELVVSPLGASKIDFFNQHFYDLSELETRPQITVQKTQDQQYRHSALVFTAPLRNIRQIPQELIYTVDEERLWNASSLWHQGGALTLETSSTIEPLTSPNFQPDENDYRQFEVTSNDYKINWYVPNHLIFDLTRKLMIRQLILFLAVLLIGGAMIVLFMRKTYMPLEQSIARLDKPFESGDLHQTIDQFVDEWINRDQFHMRLQKTYQYEKLFYSILNGSIHPQSPVAHFADEFHFDLAAPAYVLLVMPDVLENANLFMQLTRSESLGSSSPIKYSHELYIDEVYVFILSGEKGMRQWLQEHTSMTSSVVMSEELHELKEIPRAYQYAIHQHDKEQSDVLLFPRDRFHQFQILLEEESYGKALLILQGFYETIKENSAEPNALILMSLLFDSFYGKGSAVNRLALDMQGSADPTESVNYLYEYLARDLKQFEEETLKDENVEISEDVTWIVKYIFDHYCDEDFSVSALADEVHMSPSALSHYFKRSTGSNISTYVEELRMERAKVLLRETNFTIAEISERVGYRSSSTFIEAFKRHAATTPGKWRKANRQKT